MRNATIPSLLVLVFLLGLSSVPASDHSPRDFHRTDVKEQPVLQFQVKARDRWVARKVAEAAEHHRKVLAQRWLGHELPPWQGLCPINVRLTAGATGGATTFAFDQGRILVHRMQLEGSLVGILTSALPHEVMHTILAHHFREMVPRWADEGVAVCAEVEASRVRYDKLAWEIVNTPGRAIPLRRLLTLRQYPPDVMALYAQGYSLTRFLVEREGERTFLAFVGKGRTAGWDFPLCDYYGFEDVEDLEKAWLAWLKDQRKQREVQPAQNERGKR